MLDSLLSGIIAVSQKTPFRGRGGYTNLPKDRQQVATPLEKGEAEAADVDRFFQFFPSAPVREEIAGKSILDFGSGYGGRTVEYVRICGANDACGVEPFQNAVDAGTALAAKRSLSDKVHFKLCTQESIPYEDRRFDAILTFDVLEHVADPRTSLQELYRVLKPGGSLYAVFPVYRGAFSHHLDYLTLVPGLHLLFGPDRLLRVVNRHLDARPDIIVGRHDRLPTHYKTGKPVLPMLNGMGLRDFKEAIEGWKVRSLTLNSIPDIVLGRRSLVSRLTRPLTTMPPVLAEPFVFNVAVILTRPAES